MKFPNLFPFLLFAATFIAWTACNQFTVENVNYSQYIESVLSADERGMVEDIRHGLTFNVKPFEKEEFGDQDSISVELIRLIRNAKGLYYITAPQFKNVYVMEPQRGSLKLIKKIKISEERLTAPALNMRDGYVELVKTETNEVIALNKDGIKQNINEEEQS